MVQRKHNGSEYIHRLIVEELWSAYPNTETLSAGKTLTITDKMVQYLDPGGTNRTITLPAEASSQGKTFVIVHQGSSGEILTVNNDGGTAVAKLDVNQVSLLVCDGATWVGLTGWYGTTGLTATVTELNKLDGVTATAAELNNTQKEVGGATFVIGAQAGNGINLGIQLEDADGNDLAEFSYVWFYLSGDSGGDGVVDTGPSGGIAIGTDGSIITEPTTDKVALLQSEVDGDIDIDITDTGTPTFYGVVVLPNGTKVVSSAITFT